MLNTLTKLWKFAALAVALAVTTQALIAEISLESEILLNDQSLFFDGKRVKRHAPNREGAYDYFFGNALVPHGDCIKTYKQYVFMTWYRGGKEDRHVMLTRLNTETGNMVTIEFPHRHTGYLNQYWIGETHNTIAVGISPKNGTIHLLYDMHAYRPGFTDDGAFDKDYFRYSYSITNAADVPDEDFNLDLFVKSPDGDYKHLTMDGVKNPDVWGRLTYPTFFLNDQGDLFMYMRKGSAYNGRYFISKYDGESKWNEPIYFNVKDANKHGLDYTYGVYGKMKYANGKVRVAFQRRYNDRNDKYIYQNGVYYAYSDNPNGKSDWKNHKGEPFDLPLADPQFIKVFEPGDLVEGSEKDKIHMVGYFDFNVTDRGDEHIIARVNDKQNKVIKFLHLYRASGDSDFTVTTDFAGGIELYAAGNYIFMITLKDGRPFVQSTEGGTNNWKTVYQPKSGRTFDKGIPHISNGKLYYYLKSPGTGDTRTTYLQIIDLNLD
ncbi:BNR-4 repeat-containing protein [Pelagicoccus mobilis]|uniref:BNR-4 repeat-containing protein n=1 Tax=Pelagicoccus mobilis TaxID=415221 RepID=A0A934S2C4_9BACT|nr:BNR-4 repeat-containing protein [Pelagicoccus mobilis]MBK1879361.1 BNR-4 repeat-containing protein [Pelagicoccus mobilis]